MVLMLDGEAPVVFDLASGVAESTWSRAELPVVDAWVYVVRGSAAEARPIRSGRWESTRAVTGRRPPPIEPHRPA